MPEEIKPVESNTKPTDQSIELSSITKKLISALKEIKPKHPVDEFTKLTVSQTASFLALIYEKVRNSIEDREDHLIRRAAIERILKRRLSLNPTGKNEGENLLRELMWARYFPNGSLAEHDIREIQTILNKYLELKNIVMAGKSGKQREYLSEYLMDLFSAEIEELLNREEALIDENLTYFIFETLKSKVKIEDLDEKQKDTFLFIAIENCYRKSDRAYQRYHLFRLYYKRISEYTSPNDDEIISKLPSIFKKIDELISNRTVEKLIKFTRKQLPPYLILFYIIRDHKDKIEDILSNKQVLWNYVEKMATNKYAQLRKRLNTLAFRSLVYIFITKMLFALILEVPVSQLLYNHISYIAIGINSLFPPLLMLIIILTVTIPGADNTRRLYLRLLEIINADPTYEKTVAFITQKARQKRPILAIGFTSLYTATFVVTLYLIHYLLGLVHFNLLSEALFIFFISVVAFFSYRIKQLANMYRITEKGNVLGPIVDFFFMPILSLGKIFSEGVSKINFFIVIFDFIIEAPFKLIVEVIEEWIKFVRQKKEDIV